MNATICNSKQVVCNFLRIVAAFAFFRDDASMRHVADFYAELAQIQRDYAANSSTFSASYIATLTYAAAYAKHCRVSANTAMRISNTLSEMLLHEAQLDNLHNLCSEEIHSIIEIIENNYDETLFDYIEEEEYELFLE